MHPPIQKSLWHFPLGLHFLDCLGDVCKMHPRCRNTYVAMGPRHILSVIHLHADLSTQSSYGWENSSSERGSDWAKATKPWSVGPHLSHPGLNSLAKQKAGKLTPRPRRVQLTNTTRHQHSSKTLSPMGENVLWCFHSSPSVLENSPV